MYIFPVWIYKVIEVWIGAGVATNDGPIKSCQSRCQTLILGLRSDIHCLYYKSIVYVTCTVDFQYWQWISERSEGLYPLGVRCAIYEWSNVTIFTRYITAYEKAVHAGQKGF